MHISAKGTKFLQLYVSLQDDLSTPTEVKPPPVQDFSPTWHIDERYQVYLMKGLDRNQKRGNGVWERVHCLLK